MRRATRLIVRTGALALAGLLAGAFAAEAASRKVVQSRPLTIKQRPFTDSGNVVRVGTQSNYVYESQYSTRGGGAFARTGFGGETLPGRFELPSGGGLLFNF